MTKQVACTPKGRFIVDRSVGRVGRICDKDLKCIIPFIVGRIASAARRPRVGLMWPILASDRSDHSDASAACRWRNGSETLED